MTQIIEQTILPPLAKESLEDIVEVLILNAAAGNQPPAPEQLESQIMRQTRVDLAECLELLEAVSLGTIGLLRDGLSDKRVTLNGFSTILPFSLSDDFVHTMENLFTRFDSSLEDAILTQQKYAQIGVATIIEKNVLIDEDGEHEDNPVYFVNKVEMDVTGTDGEFYPKGKFLKSVNFRNDNFDEAGVVISTSPFAVEDRWQAIRKMLTSFIDKMDEKCAVKESLND